ncbi:TPA: hypothetical protein ACM4BP_004769, partial [Escherichia coli]
HHAFSSGAGRTSDGNGSHASTLKSPSYTKSVSWQHYLSRRCRSGQRILPDILPGRYFKTQSRSPIEKNALLIVKDFFH